MAYNPSNLSALAYCNGFTLWHYKSPDLCSTIEALGYFNRASTMLRPGDFIIINGNTNGPVQSTMAQVVHNNGKEVLLSAITSFGK